MKSKFDMPLVRYFLDMIWPFWAVQLFFLGSGKVTLVWWTLTTIFHVIFLWMAYERAKMDIHISDPDS